MFIHSFTEETSIEHLLCPRVYTKHWKLSVKKTRWRLRSGGPGHVGYGEASGLYSLWDAMTPVLHSLCAWLLLCNLAYDSGLGCVTCFHQWDISKQFKWRLEKHCTIGLPHYSSCALASLLETRTVEQWLGQSSYPVERSNNVQLTPWFVAWTQPRSAESNPISRTSHICDYIPLGFCGYLLYSIIEMIDNRHRCKIIGGFEAERGIILSMFSKEFSGYGINNTS